MIRIAFLFVLFILQGLLAFSQGVNNLWLMGYGNPSTYPFGGIKMDFYNGNPSTTPEPRICNLDCTNGLISDSIGQLLFVTNGIFIQNNANDTMLNGSGLNPSYFTSSKVDYGLTIPQANLVIPFPDDKNKYYLFHETCDDYGFTYCTLKLYYSIIDMSRDSGRGEVINKNIVLLNDSLVGGRLTSCKHANGRDWWTIIHKYNSDLYYKYLITPLGIQGPFLQNIGEIRGLDFGQSVFSPDGKYYSYYEPTKDLDIFDFDRCTGEFTLKSHIDINDSAVAGGVAFSNNSRVLYVSSEKYVYQFDLNSTNISNSKTTVAVYDGYSSPNPPFATTFYLAQLANDGKIYINNGNGTLRLHVINNPDSLGLGCNVCQHCIHLTAYNAFTIPNYPNYFLGAEAGSICDSLLSVKGINSENFNLCIYPNPVTYDELTINYSVSSHTTELIISNIQGESIYKQLLPQWSSTQKIKLPEINAGIYFARILNSNINKTVKFIVE